MGHFPRGKMTKEEQQEIRELKEQIRLLKRLAKLRDLRDRLQAHPGLTLHTNEEKIVRVVHDDGRVTYNIEGLKEIK